jgi:hypothetical protein
MPAIASGIHCVTAYIGATLEISRVLSQESAKPGRMLSKKRTMATDEHGSENKES